MARSPRRARSGGRSLRVDFTNAGDARFLPPEGEYVVEITKVEKGESSQGNDQLQMDFRVIEGKHANKSFRQWFSLVDNAVWRLANLLRSAGMELPNEAVDLNFDDIEGLKLIVTVDHREYNGEKRADISDSASLEEVVEEEDEEEDEKPARGKRKADDDDEEEKPARNKRRAKDEDEEDEEDEEEKPARGKRKAKDDDDEDEKPARRSRKSKDDDEDDEEEDEKPAPKKKKSGKLSPISADEVDEMSSDELDDLVEKYSLEVDLSAFKTVRRKIAAVSDALEAAGYLAD